MTNDPSPHSADADSDAERLAALGYKFELKRDMSLWANFALGFTYLSPAVGIYTLFATSLMLCGAPMMWALLGVGQLLVAIVFGEIVSQLPLARSVYPWLRSSEYDNWIVVLSSFAVIAIGLIYMWIARPHLRSTAIYGDSISSNNAVANDGDQRASA